MAAGQLCLGLFVVGCFVLAAASTGRSVCAVLVPDWRGPTLALAQANVAVVAVLAEAHALGAVGLFRRGWLVATAIAVALLSRRLGRRRSPRASHPATTPIAPVRARGWRGTWLPLVTAATVCVMVGQWVARIAETYNSGIREVDSLQYHLPHAARWAQTGYVTGLHFVSFFNPENTYHPSDSDLLHAIGMALTSRDVLSPLVNLGFVAMLLLAAWCMGTTRDTSCLALIGAVVVLAMPMTMLSAGSATSDVASIAMLVSAVVFGLQSRSDIGPLALSGAAAGVALGMKLTVLAPVAVVCVGTLLLIRGAHARSARIAFVTALVATGAFWYVRNLVAIGNPVPGAEFGPFHRVPGSDLDAFTIVHYVRQTSVWRDYLLPGLATGANPLWWLVVIIAVAAIVMAFRRTGAGSERLVAVAIVFTVVVYVVTPNSAAGPDGTPWLFALNVRYAFPAVVLALALPARLLDERGRWFHVAVAGYVVLFLASELAGRSNLPGLNASLPAWPDAYRLLGVLTACALLATWFVVYRSSDIARALTVCGVATVVLGMVGGLAVVHRYYDGRYSDLASWSVADALHDERVAVTGSAQQYQYYGRDLSNEVQFLGRRVEHGGFQPFASCRDWADALRDGGYGLVVVMQGTDEDRWVSQLSKAELSLRDGPVDLYRVGPGVQCTS